MRAVTDDYLTKMSQSFRTHIPRITISGVEIKGDIQSGLTINKGSCGSNEFTLGALYIPYISGSITNAGDIIQDKELLLEMGLLLDDNTVEYVPIGYFTASSVNVGKYVTGFTAYGRLANKTNRTYVSSLDYPTTVQRVIDEISEQIGVPIILNNLEAKSVIYKQITGIKHREALNYIAALLGGFCTEDAEGQIVISKFVLNKAVSIDTAFCYEYPESSEEKYTITGLEIVVEEPTDEDEGEAYRTKGRVNVSQNNPYMNAELFDVCQNNIVGFSYMPTKMRFLGDIRLEPWDSIEVTDGEESNPIDVPCMEIIQTWDGGLVTTIVAPGITETEEDSGIQGPLSALLERTTSALTSQGTQLEIMRGQISAKVWQQDLDNLQIGGRNLIINSKTMINENYGFGDYTATVSLTNELDERLTDELGNPFIL